MSGPVTGYDRQEPNALLIGLATITILVGTVLAGVVLRSYFEQVRQAEYHEKVEATPNKQWDALRAKSAEKLSSYGWNDQEKQVAHIPIARAMELTVADLKAKAAAPAPAPAPAPATKK